MKRILLPSQTLQSTPTEPVNSDFINPEDSLAHRQTVTYSYSVSTDRLHVYLSSFPFTGSFSVLKNPARDDMYVNPATTDSVLHIHLYTDSAAYWTIENESDYYLVFSLWCPPGVTPQNILLAPHQTYSTLQKVSGYHTFYLSYILKQGGTRKRFAPQITRYPLSFQPFNENETQVYIFRRDSNYLLVHPSISIGLFGSSTGSKTCTIEIDKVAAAAYAGRGVTGPDTVFLELDTLDRWHIIPIACTTSGWTVQNIKWTNKTDYYLCVHNAETFDVVPPRSNRTIDFVTHTNNFYLSIYYSLNGGGLLTD